MRKLTLKEYNKIDKDYRGIFEDYQGNAPHLKGRRTMLANEEGRTVLIFEGIHFEIVG
ncbi:MAG: hypothetical protein ACRCX8_06550 [Sarcina sp.]